jgi:flagellar motility protein MotE (MotC chaperone)
MKRWIGILFGVYSFFHLNSFAQDNEAAQSSDIIEKKESEVITSASSGIDPKKQYTVEEFKEAVIAVVEKKLRLLKRESIINFSKELLKKEDSIALREISLKRKEEAFLLSQNEFKKKIEIFHKEQQKFIGCLDQNKKDENKRLSHMVDTIGGMRPNVAADVLSVQDHEIAIKILNKLDPVKVSKIFNLMDKEISARLQKQYMTMEK